MVGRLDTRYSPVRRSTPIGSKLPISFPLDLLRGLEWGPMAATGVTIIVPVFILVWLLQKDFVQGLTLGSVKG